MFSASRYAVRSCDGSEISPPPGLPRFAVVLFFLGAIALGSLSRPPSAHAQSSVPLYRTTYCVQVHHLMWRNGANYWATEYETSDLNEARFIFALFEVALEDGSLGEILGMGFDWIPIDLRIKTKYEWNIYPIRQTQPTITRYHGL